MDVNGVALVVGAGSGIGLEAAFTFAEKGARGVVFADINKDSISAAVTQSKALATSPVYRALAIQVDVVDRLSVRAMVSTVTAEFGRIDYAVNCAGVSQGAEAALLEIDGIEFDRLQDVNTKGILHCLQEQIRVMKTQDHLFAAGRSGPRSIGSGSIVNITSLPAMIPAPKAITYAASKYVARGIIQCAAVENRQSGLRINEICPGYTHTPMLQKAIGGDPKVAALINNSLPLGRVAAVEEIAGVAHFLASPAASYVNGQCWVVDSGVSVIAMT